MTDKEIEVIDALVAAWNAFVQLPVEHPDDTGEFRQGIHRLQDKILARPARRTLNAPPSGEDRSPERHTR